MTRNRAKRFDILGIEVSATNLYSAIRTMTEWIENGEKHYMCVANVHLLVEAQRDPKLRDILNCSGLTTPDGMPLVWIGKCLGHSTIDRVYGADLMLDFSDLAAQKGYANFYYGGDSGIAEKLAERLTKKYPGLKVVGTYSPPFRPLSPKEDNQIVDMINEANPDVVWVGLGAPKQDRWMAEHMGCIKAPVMVGVGAAFDFLSGQRRQAPRWMQRSGLEWLFRLITEPRRLWKRYLVTNTLFIYSIVPELLKSFAASRWARSKNRV